MTRNPRRSTDGVVSRFLWWEEGRSGRDLSTPDSRVVVVVVPIRSID